MRCRGVTVAVAAALAVAAAAAAFAGGASAANGACRTNEVRAHNEIVFGHFSTLAAAKKMRAKAASFAFQGVKVENEGCGDFEVEIDGADTDAVRQSVAVEALKAGFLVTFEQTGEPLDPPHGQVVGILASKRTVAQANALMWQLAHANFRYIDLAYRGDRWLVVMPQVPVKSALSIAAEVSKAGFHVAFQPAK